MMPTIVVLEQSYHSLTLCAGNPLEYSIILWCKLSGVSSLECSPDPGWPGQVYNSIQGNWQIPIHPYL